MEESEKSENPSGHPILGKANHPALIEGYETMKRLQAENENDPEYQSNYDYRQQKDRHDLHGENAFGEQTLIFQYYPSERYLRDKANIPSAEEQVRINRQINDAKEHFKNNPNMRY